MKASAKAKLDSLRVEDGLTLGGHAVVDIVTIDGYKFVMDDGGWLLVRFSGTEPLIRVYTESTDEAAVPGHPGRRAETGGDRDLNDGSYSSRYSALQWSIRCSKSLL